MASSIYRNLVITLIFFGCATLAHSQENNKPLADSELLALVAGNVLSENVVHEIDSRGLAFRPDDTYRFQLTTAGADAHVLTALSKAKTSVPSGSAEKKSSSELLQHLAMAGELMRNKQFEEAAGELNGALQSNGGLEAGFVMGELLRRQEKWPTAAAIYGKVLQENSDFPEAHTKLSFLLYRLGDPEESLREAKAALARTPDNAEAHKNAGLALESARKFDPAVVEYKEALRIKPDYQAVRYDLGLLLYNKGDLDGSIAEYKKAIALDPNDAIVHYNLGVTYHKKDDFASAIREYREAKRLDPKNLTVRQSLGSALGRMNLHAEAVIEFRELEAMAPDSEVCHICLGGALHNTWDFQGAAQEYRKATELDPSDPEPHIRLGAVREDQKNYDAALKEYRLALQLDENSADAHRNAGRAYIAKKDLANALLELKDAENLQPGDWLTHELYGRALLSSGNPDAAIAEFKQSLALDPKQSGIQLELAAAYEEKGDWGASLDQYHKAALADARLDYRNKVVRADAFDPQKEYATAQERFRTHIASLKASGKSAEAASLEARVHASNASPNLTEKLDHAMQAGAKAASERHFDEAQAHYKEAVKLAEQLQPHDQRLAIALDHLGNQYLGQDFAAANAAYSRELKVVEELYGPQSSALAQPLQSLGTSAIIQHDYSSALMFYTRAVKVTEKDYGEASHSVAESLRILSRVYLVQKQFDRAEPILLRAVKIDESLFGPDGRGLLLPLSTLCGVYDAWGKPEKSEPCDRQLLSLLEKVWGENSLQLLSTLKSEAQALRSLGRIPEAAAVEQRIKTIQATAMNQN